MSTTRHRRRALVSAAVAVLVCALPQWSGQDPARAAAPSGSAPRVTTQLSRALPTADRADTPPGGLITYTLTAKNNGPSVARNVTASDTLPEGMSFVSSADGCSASGRTVTCGPEPQLGVGQTKKWTFLARLSPSYQGNGSDLGNSAEGTSDATDPDPDNNKPDPVTPPGPFTPESDISTVKTALGTGPIVPGEEYEYEIEAFNAGLSDARNVSAVDTLPDGISFVSSADPCTASGQRVACGPHAKLTPGASVKWTFKVKLSAAYQSDGSDLRNTATSTSDSKDPDPTNNTSTAVLPPGGVTEPRADLWAGKEPTTTTPIAPGETFEYAVTVTNDGPSRALNAKATDTLPARLAFVGSADGCTASGQDVTCGPQAVLEPGASKTWKFTVRLDSEYTGDGTDIRNTATVSSDTTDPVPANNTSAAAGLPGSKVNKPTADLAVTKTAVGDRAPRPGETFDYRITITNKGPSADAYNVKLTDDLPVGLSYVSSSPTGCTVSGQAVNCRRTTPLKVGETAEYTLTVKVDPAYQGDGSDIKNTAHVTADNIDPSSDNDTDTAGPPDGTIAAPAADLAIVKKPTTDKPVAPGQTFDYTVTVTNKGPSQAEQVQVSDVLPTALSFVSSDDPCTAGRTVTCGPLATLAPGASVSWVFKVKLAATYTGDGDDLDNTATVSSATKDPVTDNNSSTTGPPGGKVTKPEADLEVSKQIP
ncbi:isopeptide-forming domain-containing fimbrial protein [Streptomyces alboflavus]|uniref:COG1361 S-layer family protein n=1 Tax=Streptomyces alboflavus TaxID=67267 RepID=UPI00368328B8